MSILKVQATNGKAKEPNPYPNHYNDMPDEEWQDYQRNYYKFVKEHPELILLDHQGNQCFIDGEYEVEKVSQIKTEIDWRKIAEPVSLIKELYPFAQYREAYQIVEPSPIEVQEEKSKEIVLHINISDNASPELIQAIEKMVELAYNEKEI